MKLYSWIRYWCPSDGKFELDADGFHDASNGQSRFRPKTPVKTFDEIAATPCLVLLGDPGMGKSTALEQAYNSLCQQLAGGPDLVLRLQLREYNSDERLVHDLFESEEFDRWMKGKHVLHLLLDSLDECRLAVSQVAHILSGKFCGLEQHIDRLRLRITCRSLDWPGTLGVTLENLWGRDRVGYYDLAPLTRDDVRLAARESDLDADDFVRALINTEAVPLAINPITLSMLLGQYKSAERLGRSRVDLFKLGCRALARETSRHRLDAGHRGRLDSEQRLKIAGQIAAVIVFGGFDSINADGTDAPSGGRTLTMRDLVDAPHAAADRIQRISESEVLETLNTTLFSSRGPGRFGFSHQTYAEFLAAWYLKQVKLHSPQKLSLLRQPRDDRRRITPQLHQAAGWVASMDSDVFDAILADDPTVLLTSDAAATSGQQREKLVARLLEWYDRPWTYSDWAEGRLYHKLIHPGLARQLKRVITDRAKEPESRIVAMRIARACKLVSIGSALAGIALDPSDDSRVRRYAIRELSEVGVRSVRRKLLPLLSLAPADDPNDDFLGVTLEALWPDRLITAEQLAAIIRPPQRSDSYVGSYSLFIDHDLVESVTAEEAVVLLDAITERGWIPGHEMGGKFPARLIAHAIQHPVNERLMQSIARLLVKRSQTHEPPIRSTTDVCQAWLDAMKDTVKRRALLRAIVPMFPLEQVYLWALIDDMVLDPDDVAWLLDWLNQAGSDELRRHIGNAIRSVYRLPESAIDEHYHSFIEAYLRFPEAFERCYDPVPLDSEIARRGRESRDQWQNIKRMQESRIPKPTVPPPAEQIETCLQRFENGDTDAGWQLHRVMMLGQTQGNELDIFEHDVTQLPGWKSSVAATRSRIVATAEAFLDRFPFPPRRWPQRGSWNHAAAAGYRSLVLIRRHDPAAFNALGERTWRQWVGTTLVCHPRNHTPTEGDPVGDVTRRAYAKAPGQFLETLRKLVHTESRESQPLLSDLLGRVEHCCDERMSLALMRWVKTKKLHAQGVGEIVGFLLARGFEPAKSYAARQITQRQLCNGKTRERAISVAVALMDHTADHGWSKLWPAIRDDEAFGREVLSRHAQGVGHRKENEFAARRSEKEVADLYHWLMRCFPPGEDPKPEGFHLVGSRECVAGWRDGLLRHLQGRGTDAAMHELRRIRDQLPEHEWLQWHVDRGEEAWLLKSWEPPTPEQILALCRDPGRRLIRGEGDLLDVVVESLGRLKNRLHDEGDLVECLWNDNRRKKWWPKDEEHLSGFIMHHLRTDLRELLINSEVTIRRDRKGPGSRRGQRTDLLVSARIPTASNTEPQHVKLIIEVKGVWNRELRTAMQEQLADRYLRENSCRCGLYVVGWFNCKAWSGSAKAVEDRRLTPQVQRMQKNPLEEALQNQAEGISTQTGLSVRHFVLDASLRSSKT